MNHNMNINLEIVISRDQHNMLEKEPLFKNRICKVGIKSLIANSVGLK